MYQVEINWLGTWLPVGPPYPLKDDAEHAIVRWRQLHGSNGRDVGFRIREV